MKRKIILDCDPGIDDAYAILYAIAHPELDVLGITTVSGNVNVDKTTENAQRLVSLSGKNIRIAKGSSKPLIQEPIYAEHIHGENGLGTYELKQRKAPLESENAIEWMKKTILVEGPVTLVAVGPLTNIAKLLMLYPELKALIEEIVIMGGGLQNGNTSMAAEFNFYVDPEAAHLVFKSGIKLTMAGLDVTEKCLLYEEDIQSLKDTSPVAYELAMMSEKGKEVHGFQRVYTALHDLVAVMYCVAPELFIAEDLYVEIVTDEGVCKGMSLADRRMFRKHENNTKVLLDVDRKKFVEEALKTYRYYQL